MIEGAELHIAIWQTLHGSTSPNRLIRYHNIINVLIVASSGMCHWVSVMGVLPACFDSTTLAHRSSRYNKWNRHIGHLCERDIFEVCKIMAHLDFFFLFSFASIRFARSAFPRRLFAWLQCGCACVFIALLAQIHRRLDVVVHEFNSVNSSSWTANIGKFIVIFISDSHRLQRAKHSHTSIHSIWTYYNIEICRNEALFASR